MLGHVLAVGDGEGRDPEGSDRLEDPILHGAVEAGRGLVEYEDVGTGKPHPRQRHELALGGGEVAGLLVDGVLVAAFEGGEHVVGADGPRRPVDLIE